MITQEPISKTRPEKTGLMVTEEMIIKRFTRTLQVYGRDRALNLLDDYQRILNVFPGWEVTMTKLEDILVEYDNKTLHATTYEAGELPPAEKMVRAVEKTVSDGYWWGNISWSVVFRIYQMKGYRGTVSQFVRDVSHWPFTKRIRFDCNDDAVGKPIRAGKISRSLDKWAEDGASMQFIILGEALMKILS